MNSLDLMAAHAFASFSCWHIDASDKHAESVTALHFDARTSDVDPVENASR